MAIVFRGETDQNHKSQKSRIRTYSHPRVEREREGNGCGEKFGKVEERTWNMLNNFCQDN
jgi:hypothetical protein